MAANQLELLAALTIKIKTEEKNRATVVASLISAKILTKNENFTGHYYNLKKVVTATK